MKIKWNWGTKLVLWIVAFMSFILVLVFLSTRNSIMLVEKDYYPKGLEFQTRIDERHNADDLKDLFVLERSDEFVVLRFPEIQPDSGSVYFYRHNNKELDQRFDIRPDSSWRMFFPVEDFRDGRYLVKIHWYESGKGFYVEKPFFFGNR